MAQATTRRSNRATRSTLRQLIDSRLAAAGSPDLDALVAAARAGDERTRTSWYEIADVVRECTGTPISWETLRSWYAGESRAA
jgi:hypothetical protein